jgi:trans-2,3-dihydro-3-hydroxyanthranilate isomerase
MEYRFHTADVFTDQTFGGNQLGVLPDARGLTTEQMQAITREFNYSETIFVLPPDDPKHTRRLRIFVPGKEIPFAGHPTVGGAFVLAATGEIKLDGDETRIVLEEGVGPVPVLIRSRNGAPYFTQLTAAKIPEQHLESWDAATIANLVSLSADDVDLSNGNAIEGWSAGLPYLYLPLKSRDALQRSRIRADLLEKTLGGKWTAEIVVFTKDGDDYRARMFAPLVGVAEDPATGSAAAAFAGYVGSRSDVRDGMISFTVHQGYEMGRPSRLDVELDKSNGEITSVRVGGASVLVSSGTIRVP